MSRISINDKRDVAIDSGNRFPVDAKLVDGSGNAINKDNPLSTTLDKYNTNDIIESGSVTYICKERADGEWMVLKIDSTTNNVFRYATVLNNSSITTYSDAYTNHATLTYGTYSEAF